MADRHSYEFRREAVRIALTSGLTRKQIASDLGVGFSTLSKWIQKLRPGDMPPAPAHDRAILTAGSVACGNPNSITRHLGERARLVNAAETAWLYGGISHLVTEFMDLH